MRLSAPVFVKDMTPESYAMAHVEKGYGAAWIGKEFSPGNAENAKYVEVLKQHNIIIGEVRMDEPTNVMSPDPAFRKKSIEYCKSRLALADEMGAVCFATLVGSANPEFFGGPCPENYSKEFEDAALEVWRGILNEVKPTRTKLAFEFVPFCFMDSMDNQAAFIDRLESDMVAMHFDPVNYMSTMRRVMTSGQYFNDIFDRYGSRIVSLHAKDIDVDDHSMVTVMKEKFIGEGRMDYVTYLRRAAQMPADTPICFEHFWTPEEYETQRQCFLKQVEKAGVTLVLPE
ncbi:MAG: sugar phosphate isomerase/epimerase [Lachnospiraceae bacterium]|nr:sugar phosphate isomerase/epimerase [Lachnospiraceae bacterium]MBR6349580.1 sugar phosphate isomerase/epimerase [Lachnospiraceae bacterium]